MYSLAIHGGPIHGACASSLKDGVSIGAPVMKWFALDQLAESDSRNAVLVDTSLVHSGHAGADDKARVFDVLTRAQLDAGDRLGSALTARYDYVEAFGCSPDIAAGERALAPEYETIAKGNGFAILHRLPAAARRPDLAPAADPPSGAGASTPR